MKRFLCCILILLLLPALCACNEREPILQPVNLYYRNAETSFGSASGLISAKITDGASFESTQELLNDYLRGAVGTDHTTTFPSSTKVLELEISGDTANLRMNDSLSRFTGIDLTVACACLALTTIELTGVTYVNIRTANEELDGAPSITMSRETLLLTDLLE